MTSEQVAKFVETAAIESAYDAGLAAASEVVASYIQEAGTDETALLEEIITEITALQNVGEELN